MREIIDVHSKAVSAVTNHDFDSMKFSLMPRHQTRSGEEWAGACAEKQVPPPSPFCRRIAVVRTMPGQRQETVSVLRRLRLAAEARLPLHLPQPAVSLQALPGLLYAYVEGKKFTTAEVPEDLAAKREKMPQRVEKKKEEADKPKSGQQGSAGQEDQGPARGHRPSGEADARPRAAGHRQHERQDGREMEEQAKQLGNAYLPGAQAALHNYTKLFYADDGRGTQQTAAREAVYSEALDQLGRLHALVSRGGPICNAGSTTRN